MVGRHRPLLPDRPLPARRGPAGRPPVRVHAARRRGELRRPGRRARRSSARRCSTPPRRCTGERPAAIPRMTWHEAMDRYGVDKPDLRFGMELVELTEVFAGTEFKAFAGAGAIKGIRVPGRRRRLRPQQARRADRPGQVARGQGPRVDAGRRRRRARVARRQVPVRRRAGRARRARSAPSPATCCCIVADEWMTTVRGARPAAQRPRPAAGARGPVPVRLGRRLPDVRRASSEDGHPKPGAPPLHPAASRRPRPARVATRCRCAAAPTTSCSTAGSSARARSGSTSPSCSSASSTCSASPRRRPNARFGFFLTPFRYGAPPHGGFAFGIDRLVAILAGEENIREVIAFPKTQSGADPMTGAPTPVDAEAARHPRPATAAAHLLTAR